jgi:rhodanese-related sulfurtransferase
MKRLQIVVLSLLGVAVLGRILWRQHGAPGPSITPAEVQRLMETDTALVLLDVRTAEEFAGDTGHLRGARLIPVQDLEKRIAELESYRGKKIITYCRSGNRSGHAAGILHNRGFTALNMTGGMIRWNAEQRPLVKGAGQ